MGIVGSGILLINGGMMGAVVVLCVGGMGC